MSNTYYTSLSGMMAASFGLQNTSHNVANMQSPGFKRNDVFYSSLGDNRNQDHQGCGVKVGGKNTNFSAGNYIGTQNACDMAINGQGFFIIRLKNNELAYTRDGEFGFNKEGLLTEKHSGGLVQGYDAKGNLVPIHQFGQQIHPGKATSQIELSGNFYLVEKKVKNNPKDFSESNYENIKFTLDNIFDSKGKKHQLELEFKVKTLPGEQIHMGEGLEWELDRLSYDKIALDFNYQFLEFGSLENGKPVEGANSIRLNLADNQTVSLNFGNFWSDEDKAVHLKKADSLLADSPIAIAKQDGYEEGKQIDFSFDENGQISYHYSNDQSLTGEYLALAKFTDLEHSLIQTGDNLFRAKTKQGLQTGHANKEGFGFIQSYKLESSNVDSTTEFANIVVLQRMFQACSQIMDIDKQLLEELYKK